MFGCTDCLGHKNMFVKPISVACAVQNGVLVVCSLIGEEYCFLFSSLRNGNEKMYKIWKNF